MLQPITVLLVTIIALSNDVCFINIHFYWVPCLSPVFMPHIYFSPNFSCSNFHFFFLSYFSNISQTYISVLAESPVSRVLNGFSPGLLNRQKSIQQFNRYNQSRLIESFADYRRLVSVIDNDWNRTEIFFIDCYGLIKLANN